MYKEDFQLKNAFFEELEHLNERWVCYREEPDRQVYTKPEEGQNLVSLYYRFKVPTNMFFPLALLSEVNLFKEWIPSVIKSDTITPISDFRQILHV